MKLTTGKENVCLKDLGHNLGTPERAGWVSLAFRGGRETPILPCRGWDCACVEAGRRDLPRQHVGVRAALKLSEEEWPVVATAAITRGRYGRLLPGRGRVLEGSTLHPSCLLWGKENTR